jgi:hypothetical protein
MPNWERMRRGLDIARRWDMARDWKLTSGILLGVAAVAVVIAILLGSGGGHAAPSHDVRHAAVAKQTVSRRSAAKKARAKHAAHRAHAARHHGHVSAPAHGASPTMIGVGNVLGCIDGSTGGLPILRTYHATVLRVVVQTPYGQNGQALPCVRAANATGAKVNIAIGYNNLWSTSKIVAYFRHVLSFYAPYAWAISIGNEQELAEGKGTAATPAHYAAVWRAVEPVVASLAPHAIRVAGEISPWGFSFLRSAYASGLPGAQAVAVHPYAAKFGFNLSHVVAWAHTTRLPLWATEGLTGPYAWSKPTQHAVPLSALAGVKLASAWVAQ